MGPTCSIIYENEPIEKNSMNQPPRAFTMTFYNFRELFTSIIQGLAITFAALFIYLYADLNDSGATLFGRIVALLIKAVLPELALTTNSALDTAINSNKAYF